MKAKLSVIVSAILMGTAFAASAATAPYVAPLAAAPAVPAPYGKGPLAAPYLAPNLFKSEKAAFAALEGAMQEAEAVIYQGGCAAAAGSSKYGRSWDIHAEANQYGNGEVSVDEQFTLEVEAGKPINPSYLGGTHFRISGSPYNKLNGNKLPKYEGDAYYSKTGQMMTLHSKFDVQNVNNALDYLSGSVIKDFYKVMPTTTKPYTGPRVPMIYDWGLQSVSKNYVPQDKWWQRSSANRSDGVDAVTVFEKDRLFSDKKDGVCKIKISMTGSNDASGFYQDGTLNIKRVAP